MPNQFVTLPAPAGNGVGAAVDVSSLGGVKTIVVQGFWPRPFTAPTINIELNNDVVPNGSWAPVATFRGTANVNVLNAARWLRVRVSNYKGGQAPDVNVGAADLNATFATLVPTAANGIGAAVDVHDMGLLKTLWIGNRFSGSIIMEISEDAAGLEWAESEFSFKAPGQITAVVAAYWVRIKRVGVPTVDPYGMPLVSLGGSDYGDGSALIFQEEGVVVPGGPHTIANFVGAATASNQGGGVVQISVPDAGVAYEFDQDTGIARIEDALNGDLILAILAPNPEIVDKDDLNAAPTGTFKRVFTGVLRNADGAIHEWAAFVPSLVSAKSLTPALAAAPTITGIPKFVAGFLTIEITFDTDAGATKVYAAGDFVTVEVKVSATNQLLGWTVVSTTKTYNVVA